MHQSVELIGRARPDLERCGVERHQPEPPALAIVIEEDVAHDGEQPQAQLGPGLEQVDFLDRTLERVLDQIVGGRPAARQGAAVTAQRRDLGDQIVEVLAHGDLLCRQYSSQQRRAYQNKIGRVTGESQKYRREGLIIWSK